MEGEKVASKLALAMA
jgi:hypothetical protein